jgi:heme exporter protein CcmD
MADDYAAFIWPAFIVTGLVFAAMIGLSLAHARRWRRRYEELSGR